MFTTIKEDVTIMFSAITITGEIQHSPSQHALILVSDDGPAEILSTNLATYGLVGEEDTVFIKDWSEHAGVTASLAAAGVVHPVREVFVGPFKSRAYEVRILTVDPSAAVAVDAPELEMAVA